MIGVNFNYLRFLCSWMFFVLKGGEIVVQATVMFKVYWGDPKENICKSVTDIPLDFLVMGCRGLSALKRYQMVVSTDN